jgi:hypothetical protein
MVYETADKKIETTYADPHNSAAAVDVSIYALYSKIKV